MSADRNHILPFADPAKHKTSAAIIQKLSSNPLDIRNVALDRISLAAVHNVLDLGCGFGFMSAKLVAATPPGTRLIGVDIFPENRTPFLTACTVKDHPVEFITRDIKNGLPWQNGCFDLIVCSYSLYFFVESLAEIARVLHPDGWFIVITHSEHAFQGLYSAAGIAPKTSPLRSLLKKFSAENGYRRLHSFFREIETIPYNNRLCFQSENLVDLLHYVQFKLPLLVENTHRIDRIPRPVKQKLTLSLQHNQTVIIDKTDAVFRCRSPRCH